MQTNMMRRRADTLDHLVQFSFELLCACCCCCINSKGLFYFQSRLNAIFSPVWQLLLTLESAKFCSVSQQHPNEKTDNKLNELVVVRDDIAWPQRWSSPSSACQPPLALDKPRP